MPENQSAVLSSWKEIAAYLGKGVRTVQRWERELGLPVRRPVAQNARIVIAVPAELDAWIRRQVPNGAFIPQQEASARHAELERLRRLLNHMHEEMKQVRAKTAHMLELCAIASRDRTAMAKLRKHSGELRSAVELSRGEEDIRVKH